MIENLNIQILSYLTSLSQYHFIESIVCIFADLPIFFLPLFLLIYWIYYSYKKSNEKKELLLLIFYSSVIAILINLTIQHFVTLQRPEDYINGAGKLLLKHIPDASFPSDHSAVAFSFLGALFLAEYKKIAYWFLPFALIMVISRVIAGVHWPTDIIMGIIVGVFSSMVTFKYLKKQKLVKLCNKSIIKIGNFIKL